MSRPKGIKWDDQPLGKIPDTELAQRLGVDLSNVSIQRRKRGIPRHGLRECIVCGKENLGSRTKFCSRRCKHSFHTAKHTLCTSTEDIITLKAVCDSARAEFYGRIGWDLQPLGGAPDTEIARRLGVDRTTVLYHRRKRGIPAFKG